MAGRRVEAHRVGDPLKAAIPRSRVSKTGNVFLVDDQTAFHAQRVAMPNFLRQARRDLSDRIFSGFRETQAETKSDECIVPRRMVS